MNICMLLSQKNSPDFMVYSRVEIASYLTYFGHSITWILSCKSFNHNNTFHLKGVRIRPLVYRRFLPGKSFPANLPNGLANFYIKMRFVHRVFNEEKFDLVFSQREVDNALIAACMGKRKHIPFVMDMPNPIENLSQMRVSSLRSMIGKYFIATFREFVRERLLHRADLIFAVSDWLRDDLVEHKDIPGGKIMVASVGVDPVKFSPENGSSVKENCQLGTHKVVVYVGTLDLSRRLTLLLESFQKVRMKREDVKLLIVGDGNGKDTLLNAARELGIENDVIFTGQVTKSCVPDYIAAADIGVSPVPPTDYYKYSSPIKLFEYMAMAKPVVANNEIPEHKGVLRESGGGLAVPFTPEAFAEAIIELLDNPQQALAMGQRGRAWVIKNRSYKVLARRLEMKYLELIERANKIVDRRY